MRSTRKKLINAVDCKQDVNIEPIAQKLNYLLEINKISTKILSDATGISVASLNNLKRGDGNPTIGTLNAISRFFGIPLAEILGINHSDNTLKDMVVVELFDIRLANNRSEPNILDKIAIEKPKNFNNQEIFGVILGNNFLSPLYEKGTIFIISTSKNITDGDMGLIRMHDSVNSLKKIFIKRENYFLKDINIDATIESFEKSEIRILGTVVQIIQKQID